MVSAVIILAAPQHHPPILTTSPPGGNDSAWSIDEFELRKSGVSALFLTMAVMAGGTVLYMGGAAAEA